MRKILVSMVLLMLPLIGYALEHSQGFGDIGYTVNDYQTADCTDECADVGETEVAVVAVEIAGTANCQAGGDDDEAAANIDDRQLTFRREEVGWRF